MSCSGSSQLVRQNCRFKPRSMGPRSMFNSTVPQGPHCPQLLLRGRKGEHTKTCALPLSSTSYHNFRASLLFPTHGFPLGTWNMVMVMMPA